MSIWTQQEAIDLCIKLERIAPAFGAHVALTGGLLYKAGPRKDCDILIYRIRQVDAIDVEGFFAAAESVGVKQTGGFGWCYKAELDGKPIDFFFPEDDGEYVGNAGACAMSTINKVILVANLGADPEVKAFQNGGRIANMRVATSESWKDKATGERKERTEWHNVVVQGDGLVGVVERYLRKGSKVYLEGSLRTRKWQDRDGNDRFTTEVNVGVGGVLTMLDGAQGGERQSGGAWHDKPRGAQGGGGFGGAGFGGGSPFPDELDDDVPFASCDPELERRAR